MKKIIFIGLLLGLYACEGKNKTPKYTRQPHQNWIPNWEKDTLVAISGNPGAFLTDVMYAETIGDSTVLYYNGVKYYVWTENVKVNAGIASYYFKPNMQSYNTIVVSKIPFSNLLNDFYSEGSSVMPARFVDTTDNSWQTQFQSILIDKKPNIAGWNAPAFYSAENKQYLD
ncbi:MAG: hypothetical protein JNM21_08745 [Taibaiella sp.]|nr:hypothetical protein [Taibaiella sp.]